MGLKKYSGDNLTPQQQIFARYLFEGKSNREAYALAKYDISDMPSVDSKASRLANSAKVLAYIAELQRKADDKSVMTVLERKQRLTEIARADLSDFVDESGNVTYSKDHANHKAVSEYNISTTYTKKGDPVVSKSIKLQNPITAIAELNKMDHVYDESNKVINNTQVIFIIGKGYQGQRKPVEIEGGTEETH